MNGRILAAGAAIAALALTLTGCGLEQPATGEGGGTPAATPDEMGEAAPCEGTVTIYSPRPSAITDHIIPEFESASGCDVQLVTLGAAEVADRVRAEAANAQADVWWGGTPSLFEAAASEDLIEPWSDDILGLVPEEFHGTDSKWIAEMRQLQLIAYNHDMIDPDDAPKDWDDLIDPKWKDKILIRDVAPSGTMRGVFAALIYQTFKDTDSPDEGYEFLKALDANTKDYAANPEDLYLRLERQEAPITIWNHQDILAQAAQGAAFSIQVPESGAPINLDGVAKVAGAPNPDGAEAFAAFLLSDETQTWLAENAFQIPTIELDSEPDWLADIDIKEMEVDRAVTAEHEQEWIDYWLENIKNQG